MTVSCTHNITEYVLLQAATNWFGGIIIALPNKLFYSFLDDSLKISILAFKSKSKPMIGDAYLDKKDSAQHRNLRCFGNGKFAEN